MKKSKRIYQSINICFIWARIISDIQFEFFYNDKKHNSIAEFIAEINCNYGSRKYKKQTILFKAYDDKADIIYRKYSKKDYIKIIGKVKSTHIEITEIV